MTFVGTGKHMLQNKSLHDNHDKSDFTMNSRRQFSQCIGTYACKHRQITCQIHKKNQTHSSTKNLHVMQVRMCTICMQNHMDPIQIPIFMHPTLYQLARNIHTTNKTKICRTIPNWAVQGVHTICQFGTSMRYEGIPTLPMLNKPRTNIVTGWHWKGPSTQITNLQ